MKRVLALYSHGGGGHVSAVEAVRAALEGSFEVEVAAPLREACAPFDPVMQLSRGRLDGEALYNALAARSHPWILTQLGRLGAVAASVNRSRLVRALAAWLGPRRPDVIISTLPFLNGVLLEVALALRLPLLVAPCDLDVRTYLAGICAHSARAATFRIGQPFTDPRLDVHYAEAGLGPRHIVPLGFPLRPPFTAGAIDAKRRAAGRAHLGLNDGRPALLLMMGSAGGRQALRYTQNLLQLRGAGLHLVVGTGRNRALAEAVRALQPLAASTPHSLYIEPFRPDAEHLFAAADLLITKSGSVTTLEAMALGLPMLFDATRGVVSWERETLRFAHERGAGRTVRRFAELPGLVSRALAAPRRHVPAVPFRPFAAPLRALVGELAAA